MADNYFDQFDTKTPAAPQPVAQGANYFDQFHGTSSNGGTQRPDMSAMSYLDSPAAGINRGIATLAGLPGDTLNWLNTEKNKGINAAFGAKGNLIQNPSAHGLAIGSQSIESLDPGGFGLNPDLTRKPEGDIQHWEGRVGEFLPSAMVPGGNLTALERAGLALTGGTGSEVGEDVAPTKYKGLGSLIGGLFGGFAPGVVARAPGQIASKMFAPTPGAASRLSDFTSEGIPPLASPVSGSNGVGYTEAALSKTPGGARVYQDALSNTTDALQQRISNLADQFGPQGTPEQIGNVIQKGIKDASARFRDRQSQLYDDALAPVLNQNVAGRSLPALEGLSSDFLNELDATPESAANTAGVALNRVNGILRDVSQGNATLDALRRVRTGIGREINDPVLAGVSGAQQPYLKQIYGALSDDLNKNAVDLDSTGTVGQKLAVADRYTRMNSNNLNFLNDFLGSKTDSQVYNAALSTAKGGGQALMAIRKNLLPTQWDQVAGTVLGRMGRATPGNQTASGIADEGTAFSPSTFLTNWENMKPEAKQAVFGGTTYQPLIPSLERLVRVSEGMRDFSKLTGGSPTYERAANATMWGGMASTAAEHLMSGDPVRAVTDPAAIFTGAYVAPKMVAKYMTDPEFINRLANRASAPSPSAADMTERALRVYLGSDPSYSGQQDQPSQSP